MKLADLLTMAAHIQAGMPTYHGQRTAQLLTIVVNGIPHLAIAPVFAGSDKDTPPEIHSLVLEFGEEVPVELAAKLVLSDYLRREVQH